MTDRNIQRLSRALHTVEQKRFVSSMQQLVSKKESFNTQICTRCIVLFYFLNKIFTYMQVSQSRALLQSLQRIEKLRITILKMDAKTMLEIRRYASPPPLVHEVMVAALLLLGDHEELTRVSI